MRLKEDEYYYLHKDEIDICLNCPKPRCVNCLDKGRDVPTDRYQTLNAQDFIRLYNIGSTAKVMAKELNTSETTVKERCKSLHIPLRVKQRLFINKKIILERTNPKYYSLWDFT